MYCRILSSILVSIHQIPVATAHHQIVTKMSPCVCAQPCLILCDPTNSCVHQAPLSMEISRQKHWSGLIFSPPGDLSHTGIEPTSLVSPASAGGFFTTVPPGKPKKCLQILPNVLLGEKTPLPVENHWAAWFEFTLET